MKKLFFLYSVIPVLAFADINSSKVLTTKERRDLAKTEINLRIDTTASKFFSSHLVISVQSDHDDYDSMVSCVFEKYAADVYVQKSSDGRYLLALNPILSEKHPLLLENFISRVKSISIFTNLEGKKLPQGSILIKYKDKGKLSENLIERIAAQFLEQSLEQ